MTNLEKSAKAEKFADMAWKMYRESGDKAYQRMAQRLYDKADALLAKA